MNNPGNKAPCMSPWCRSLNGCISLIAFFATLCCADYLKITSRAASLADSDQARCSMLEDWCAAIPRKWSWKSCHPCSLSKPEKTCAPYMVTGDGSQRRNSCSMTAFKIIDGEPYQRKRSSACSSKAANLSFDRCMTQYKALFCTTWTEVWRKPSTRSMKTPDWLFNIGSSMTMGDKLWLKGHCGLNGRRLQLSPTTRSMSPQIVLRSMVVTFISSHVVVLSSAGFTILCGMACGICMCSAELCNFMQQVWKGGGPRLCQHYRHIPKTRMAYRKGQRSSPGPKSRAKVVTFSHRCRARIISVLFNLMGPAQAGHLGE